MERVAKSQATASRKKSSIVGSYTKNWNKMKQIFSRNPSLIPTKDELLKGLQELNKMEDVKFFEEWGVQTGDYMGFSSLNVSWIWRIAMDGQTEDLSVDPSQVKQLTDTWESEGELFLIKLLNHLSSTSTETTMATLFFKK